jgi:DDE family transposase
VMQRVAETLGERGFSTAKMPSIERRLARFIGNSRIVVPVIWKLFLAQVLTPFRGQHLSFVLDNTPFRDDLTLVYLGLLVHSRVLPVAWAVMPAKTSWDEGQWQIVGRLLDQVRVHLPDTSCTLIADRGLAGMPLVKLCTTRGWHYLLRVRAEHTCRRFFHGKLERGWKRFDHIVLKRGYRWYGQARVWQEETLDTCISLLWDPTYEEPWLLISDEGAGYRQVQLYAWRMRVEATFQDSKSRGWNIEASWIVDRTHLDRLLLALFLAMWWISHLAAACIHHGQRQRG